MSSSDGKGHRGPVSVAAAKIVICQTCTFWVAEIGTYTSIYCIYINENKEKVVHYFDTYI